jgi:hypothetical protein
MSQPASTPTGNQRIAPRLKTLIAARISFNGGCSTLDCMIRNLSETGARLSFAAAVSVPDCFDLIIPQKNVTRRVRVAWQGDKEVGVRFEDAHPVQDGEPDGGALKRRIRELEAENARLRSRILQLTEG